MKKIGVGLSGGVDSCTAAYLLIEQGYDVMGIILQLKPENLAEEDIASARAIAEKLGIELKILDRREYFRKNIIDPFISEYLNARTPNPCVECNEKIKFGIMLNAALELGCDAIATGHYARIEKNGSRYLLKRSLGAKDQSYFLNRLSQFQLEHSVFPLESMEKEQIRKISAEADLPVAKKKDSQEICFVPNDDYIAFLASLGVTSPEGDIIGVDGKILGRHSGIINYTIGQRKGLGAFGKPMFVTSISAENNTVTIGENGTQYSSGLIADRVNLISLPELNEPIKADVKIRFRAKEQPATVYPLDDGKIKIIFEEPQRSVTPGQSAVFYDGDTVIGGGRIITAL